MREIKILHLFPRLLSLYGEYANVAVLRRALETLGHVVTVDSYETGEFSVDGYDLIYVGAGTEDNLMEAIRRLMPYKEAIAASIRESALWLATGNAMTLFGTSVKRCQATEAALGCLNYTTDIHESKRYLGDVLSAEAFGGAFVGFVNTSCVYADIATPLLTLRLGTKLGNDKASAESGIRVGNFYGTELIGPVLVKNPHFLAHICKEITGEAVELPKDSYTQKAYDVALAELTKRMA